LDIYYREGRKARYSRHTAALSASEALLNFLSTSADSGQQKKAALRGCHSSALPFLLAAYFVTPTIS
jgi:hypothetical protein